MSGGGMGVVLVPGDGGRREGLSYYSDRSLCQALNLSEGDLAAVRRRLMEEDLLDWEAPFYQVLSVPERRSA